MSHPSKSSIDISIILCTRNRAEYLEQTLASISHLAVPPEMNAELIIIDNGSTDKTVDVLNEFAPRNMSSRYLLESRPGKSYAYNLGLAAATGDILLFTDDDVRLPIAWIEAMCRPLWKGEDAVAGAIVLASHLERPWMEPVHHYWLAATEPDRLGKKIMMVGASMAFRRAVLEKVPAFDTSLGGGALGFSEDTLFSRQLWAAGFKIAALETPAVEHHFQPERLSRASLRDAARKRGETKAYIAHHWEHRLVRMPAARMVHKWLQITLWQKQNLKAASQLEGLPTGLMYNLEAYHFYRHYLVERQEPRLYEKHGLKKRNF